MENSPPCLTIARPIYEVMLLHVSAEMPEESCGFLAGFGRYASHLYVIENRLHSAVAFEMEPRQQVQAMLDVEVQGLTLLAAYHSHPAGPPRPSPTDIAQAAYPDLAQVIFSLVDAPRPQLAVFMIENGRVDELDWRIE